MNDEKRALVEKFWDHKKAAHRADVRRVFVTELAISQPGREEELLRRSLEAADEHVEALKQADLVMHQLNEEFPPRFLEEPVAGAWTPIIRMLALLSRRPLDDPSDPPPAPPGSER